MMNRDIFKFRAWIKPTENESGYYTYFDIYDVANIEDDGTNTIEQCIGMRDREGKLVYKNDIILFEGEKWQIIWKDEWAGFARVLYDPYEPPETTAVFDWEMEEAKVIGNTHEMEVYE